MLGALQPYKRKRRGEREEGGHGIRVWGMVVGGGLIYRNGGGGVRSGWGKECDAIGGFGWCRGKSYDKRLRLERLTLACIFDEYSSISSVRCERSSAGCSKMSDRLRTITWDDWRVSLLSNRDRANEIRACQCGRVMYFTCTDSAINGRYLLELQLDVRMPLHSVQFLEAIGRARVS